MSISLTVYGPDGTWRLRRKALGADAVHKDKLQQIGNDLGAEYGWPVTFYIEFENHAKLVMRADGPDSPVVEVRKDPPPPNKGTADAFGACMLGYFCLGSILILTLCSG